MKKVLVKATTKDLGWEVEVKGEVFPSKCHYQVEVWSMLMGCNTWTTYYNKNQC